MPLTLLPKDTTGNLTCYRCLERTSAEKAIKLAWTRYEESEEFETYCPDCTKIWNQIEESESAN